jgi:hypothetical protein
MPLLLRALAADPGKLLPRFGEKSNFWMYFLFSDAFRPVASWENDTVVSQNIRFVASN